jgi:hypothetical protein
MTRHKLRFVDIILKRSFILFIILQFPGERCYGRAAEGLLFEDQDPMPPDGFSKEFQKNHI